MQIGKRVMQWVNDVYGKQHVTLRKAIWEKGFKQGHGVDEHRLSSTGIAWLDKAIETYYTNRIYNILKKVDNNSPLDEVQKLWDAVLADMYGDEQQLKNEIIDILLKDDKVSPIVKAWLKQSAKK